MRQVLEQVKQVAATDSTVLLQGESGTGKELVAHLIHQLSPRAQRPFLAINCASMPETLVESELFGHERGAFTSAVIAKKGKLELCDEGTLFLDEIGDLTFSTQAHLLRFLEEKTFTHLGGLKIIEVDVRIVAATNKNLSQMVAEGKFREDLFYRLNVIPLSLPPLRERREDIPELADYFIKFSNARLNQAPCSLSDEGMQFLMSYAFPGNVRELKNMLERGFVFRKNSNLITAEDLCPIGTNTTKDLVASPVILEQAVEKFRREHIQKVLTDCCGNKSQAARVLGLSRPHLSALVKKIGLK
jgi:transcriptional regulator with PAS, ATPase and Fis domain